MTNNDMALHFYATARRLIRAARRARKPSKREYYVKLARGYWRIARAYQAAA